MSGFGYLVKEGFKNVWSNRIMSIASIGVLISCLVLTGTASLFSFNVEKVVDTIGQSNETNVYIKDGYSQLEAIYIGKDIERIDNVVSAQFYSKEDAFEQYREELGEELFNRIEDRNPMPDSFIVIMEDLSLYDQTVEQIMKIEGVDSVNSHEEIARKLTKISNLVNWVCIAIISALIIISLFIIANTIRATMYSRRYEISIMKSVGATNNFVRLPFLVEGIVIGLVSALISTGAISLLYVSIMSAIEQFISFFEAVPLENIILPVSLSFVFAGVFIGLFGSFISIRKYLKMEGNEILGW